LFYERELSYKEKGKPLNDLIKLYNDNYSNISKSMEPIANTASLKSTFPMQPPPEEENHK
jgi:hypothetical protein